MAINFRRFVNGVNLVPKTPNTASEMGDLEVDSSTGKLRYHNGTTAANLLTSVNPDITITTPPLKFQETGGGSDIISITAPASVPASYTLKLPPDGGTVDYVLRTDGTGATSWVPPTIDTTPTGVVSSFAGSTAPPGYKLCDGSQYDPSLEPTLYAVIGTTYNTGGENPGWFRVPDIRGRVIAGRDDMGGTPANRLTSAGSGVDGVTLGANGGSQNHSLTASENGTHNHIQDAHTHGTGSYANASSSVSGTITASASAVSGTVGSSDGTHSHSASSVASGDIHRHSYPASGDDSGEGGNGESAAPFGSTISSSGGGPNANHAWMMNSDRDDGFPGYVASSYADQTHAHTITVDVGGGHNHSFSLTAAAQSIIHALVAAAQIFSGISGSTVATNQNSGSGTAHQNTQPTFILNYIIKA